MKKSKIAKIVSLLLKIVFILGIVCLFFVPKLYDLFPGIQEPIFEDQTIYYKVAIYTCGIGVLGVVYELIQIFNIVYEGSPFKKEIELSLKRISVLFMVISLITAVKTIFITTILSIAVSIILFIASLSFYVLSQIFKVAIEYKNEIDFTI